MIYMKFDYIDYISTGIRDILLWKCEWTTNGQTDGLGMPNYCHANTSLWAFGSGELNRKLRRQGELNPPIFLCLKQSRSYQNDLAYIQKVKKTAHVIFCFSSFDTDWKF